LIVLDASVLIAHLDDSDGHHEAAMSLLFNVADQGLGISPISLAEVLVGPARRGQLDRALAALAQLDLNTIAFEDDASLRLALLRSSTNLKLPDCCVLLAAEKAGAAVASFDEQLRGVATQLGMVVLPGD
jgi:predicted nucleic acid-binding protein